MAEAKQQGQQTSVPVPQTAAEVLTVADILKKMDARDETHRQELAALRSEINEKKAIPPSAAQETVKRVDSLTAMPQARVDAFMALKPEEDNRIFASKIGNHTNIPIPHGPVQIDPVSNARITPAPVSIRFMPYTDVGAEIKDPNDRTNKKRLFEWGVCDLAQHPYVISSDKPAATIKMLKNLIAEKCPGWRRRGEQFTTDIFGLAMAQAVLRIQYQRLANERDLRGQYEETMGNISPALIKGGHLDLFERPAGVEPAQDVPERLLHADNE